MHTALLIENSVVGTSSKTGIATMAEPSIGALLIKMVLILGVLALVAWYLRHRGNGPGLLRPFASGSRAKSPSPSPTRSALRILSRQPLGKGAYLAVVSWEDHEVLVGVSNTGIAFYRETDANIPLPIRTGVTPTRTLAQTRVPERAASAQATSGVDGRVIASRSDVGPWASLPAQSHLLETSILAEADDLVTRPSFLSAVRDLTVRR